VELSGIFKNIAASKHPERFRSESKNVRSGSAFVNKIFLKLVWSYNIVKLKKNATRRYEQGCSRVTYIIDKATKRDWMFEHRGLLKQWGQKEMITNWFKTPNGREVLQEGLHRWFKVRDVSVVLSSLWIFQATFDQFRYNFLHNDVSLEKKLDSDLLPRLSFVQKNGFQLCVFSQHVRGDGATPESPSNFFG
jgi:hypothetical protein